MNDVLYHISEEAGIREFIPRPVTAKSTGITEPVVWAVDEAHLVTYLLPRDCPRVTFRTGPDTTDADARRFLTDPTAARVIIVESGWYTRITAQRLVMYRFADTGFEPADTVAGYYVNRGRVVPAGEEELANPLRPLLERNVEVRFVHSLWDVRERIIRSSMEYSIIRMRNAAPPAPGTGPYHPLPE